jgi:hypothetical protein
VTQRENGRKQTQRQSKSLDNNSIQIQIKKKIQRSKLSWIKQE